MGKQILVVEDEVTSAEVMSVILIQQGYKLTMAVDGVAAYKQALKTKPDLVLMDVDMPGMNGFETCKLFKGDQALTNIPIIFVTASLKALENAYEVGAADYITKPIMPTELTKRVGFHLERQDFSNNIERLNLRYRQEIEQQKAELVMVTRKWEKAEQEKEQLKRDSLN